MKIEKMVRSLKERKSCPNDEINDVHTLPKQNPVVLLGQVLGGKIITFIYRYSYHKSINMIPHKIYEIGAMLGLENKDIRDLASDISDKPDKLEMSLSPTDTYKGLLYGTVSLKDFQ